jgi:WD40 repeat protein
MDLPEESSLMLNGAPGLEFSPGGDLLAICTCSNTIHLWKTGAWRSISDSGAHGVTFSPDGHYAALLWDGGIVTLRRVRNWQLQHAYRVPGGRSVCFSPDSRRILIGGTGGQIQIFGAPD